MDKLVAKYRILSGDSYEIGKNQGEAMSKFPKRLKIFANGTNMYSEAEKRNVKNLFETYCPGLNEEIEGFADAVKIDKFNIIYYALTYLKPACSQFALLPEMTSDGHILVARSYEFSHETEEMLLLKTKVANKYVHLGTGILQFGRTEGINEHGLVVSQTSAGFPVGNFGQMRKPAITGLQFWAVIRALLENCKTVKEALDYVKDMPIAYNINLLLADKAGNAALFETLDGRKSFKCIDANTERKYIHSTNHIHIDELSCIEPMAMYNSVHRYDTIEEFVTNKKLNRVQIQEFLGKKYPDGLCCYYYDEFFGTIKSMVIDVTLGELDICWSGNVSKGWKTFKVREDYPEMEWQVDLISETAPENFFKMIKQ